MNLPSRYVPATLAMLLLFLLAVLPGCAQPSEPKAQVTLLNNQDLTALDADDVVRIMRRAGFSDEQILDFGTELRNGLASTGAVQIKIGNKVEAIFAVHGQVVQASARRRGSFTYDPTRREFH